MPSRKEMIRYNSEKLRTKKSTGITQCPKIELTKHETGRSPLRADDDTGHIAMHVIIVQTVFGSVHVYFFRFSGVTGTDAPDYRVAVFVASSKNFVFSSCRESIDMAVI